jgi:hypothetical protein
LDAELGGWEQNIKRRICSGGFYGTGRKGMENVCKLSMLTQFKEDSSLQEEF